MLDATQRSSVIFSAYAKLPAGITAYEVHKVIGVVVEIDMHTGRILQAECTLATKLASDFIAKMLVGYNMNDGLDELNAMIEKHYQASAKKAVLTAVRMLNDKFISHKNGEGILLTGRKGCFLFCFNAYRYFAYKYTFVKVLQSYKLFCKIKNVFT